MKEKEKGIKGNRKEHLTHALSLTSTPSHSLTDLLHLLTEFGICDSLSFDVLMSFEFSFRGEGSAKSAASQPASEWISFYEAFAVLKHVECRGIVESLIWILCVCGLPLSHSHTHFHSLTPTPTPQHKTRKNFSTCNVFLFVDTSPTCTPTHTTTIAAT